MGELLVITSKSYAPQTKLVSLCGPFDSLHGAASFEIALGKHGECDHEAWVEQLVHVLTGQLVLRLPFNVDDARVRYDQVVVGHLEIQGELLRHLDLHGGLCVLRDGIDLIKSCQVRRDESFLNFSSALSLQTEVVQHELEFFLTSNTLAKHLGANVESGVKERGKCLLLGLTRLVEHLDLPEQLELLTLDTLRGQDQEAVVEQCGGVLLEQVSVFTNLLFQVGDFVLLELQN